MEKDLKMSVERAVALEGSVKSYKLQAEAFMKEKQQLSQEKTENDSKINDLTTERDQLKRSTRLIRIAMEKELEQELKATLSTMRKEADAQEQKTKKRVKEFEARNTALLNSTSWKITRPLRRIVSFFR